MSAMQKDGEQYVFSVISQVITVVLMGSVVACYNPKYGDGNFTCGAQGECPDGFVCGADDLCRREGSPVVGSDATSSDADVEDSTPSDADVGRADGSILEPDAEIGAVHDDCTQADVLTEGVTTLSSTLNAADDYDLSCAIADGDDTVHQFTLANNSAVLVTVESDTPIAASIRTGESCESQADLACIIAEGQPLYFTRPILPMGEYSVVVDSLTNSNVDYSIAYDIMDADVSFGYWQIASSSPYQPLGADTTPLEVIDNRRYTLELPFEFPFFGQKKTEVQVSTNGYLTFAEQSTAGGNNNDCPLDVSTPLDLVAVFWDDLVPGEQSKLQYKTVGESPHRRFVVEWEQWDIAESTPCNGTCDPLGASITHQVMLFENGDIEFRYGPRTVPIQTFACENQHLGCSASIGLRNLTGDDIDTVSCNTNRVTADDVVHFVYPR